MLATVLCGPHADGQALAPADRQLAHDILQQLITTDTTHSSGSTRVAAEAMRDRLLKAEFPAGDMEIIGPKGQRLNLVVRYRAAKGSNARPVMFICHLDVVEAMRSDWTMDPFQLTEKDGFFYGRGTQDVKDSDAALVTSLLLLKRAGFVPKRDILVALTADEEGGADNGVDWLLKNRPDLVNASVVINPDAGGVEVKGGKPAELDVEATEKLYADFQLVTTSAGGHSSLPRADNPIYELGDALARLEKQPFPAELNEVTRAYLANEAKTAAPDRRALIARVLATPMDAAAAHSKLTVNYVDNGGAVFPSAPTKGAMAPPPMREDVMRPLRRVTESEFGPIPILSTMETGASDSIYTLAAGIPSYGISGMGIDEGDDRAHGRDERIRVESFYQGVAFQRRFMQALGEE